MTPSDFRNRTDFQLREVSAGAHVSPETVKSWLRKGVILGHPVTGGGGKGRRRNFTFQNLMEIAVASSLQEAGLFLNDAAPAFRAAREFAHVGGGALELPLQPRRDPGFPFEGEAVTFLAIGGGAAVCIAWKPGGKDLLPSLRHALRKPTGLHLLDCSAVFARVCAAFGLEAGEVMRAAYAEDTA